MRTLLTVKTDVSASNKAVMDGSLAETDSIDYGKN
jgi:hypothetical protein